MLVTMVSLALCRRSKLLGHAIIDRVIYGNTKAQRSQDSTELTSIMLHIRY
ncbi:hypothetical protein ACVQ79_00450 [Vibrio cholerae]|nr:hypothetical protein [Vibrio cholerae]HDI3159045.1 hypothetical protein [Vibrio cholerae]HDI3210508.1 hypothetical protein [Vibrio cholerae]